MIGTADFAMIMRAAAGLLHPPRPDSSRRTLLEARPAMTADHSISAPITFKVIDRLLGYRFGDDGSIWSRRRSAGRLGSVWRRIYPNLTKAGRLRVRLSEKPGEKPRCYLVHRLILEAFRGTCPDGLEACHNDGDPLNNRLENLRWDTHKSNVADRKRHDEEFSVRRGTKSPLAKLSEADLVTIRRLRLEGWSCERIGVEMGVTASTIQKADTGGTYRNVIREEVPGPVRYPTLLGKFGSANPGAKLTEADIPTICRLHDEGLTLGEIANIYSVSRMTIHLAVKRKTWRHVVV